MLSTKPIIISLREGERVKCGANNYVILKIISLDKILAKNLETLKNEVLNIAVLEPLALENEDSVQSPPQELTEIPESDWQHATRILEIIKPLLKRQRRGEMLAEKIAAESGYSRASLFRWAGEYKRTGLLSSLIPTKRDGGKGVGRISKEVETVIDHVIQTKYLSTQQYSITQVVEEIRELCDHAGLSLPHRNTIRKRIEWIEEREKVSRRRGKHIASNRFEAIEGSVPDADWPLAMVQIDHTVVNVIIVHEETRKPMRRAWITLAIDVYSRVIVGMYLTLDSPSFMSAGMCLAHAILPKEKWLLDIGLDNIEWPCWGVMGSIHMDNAREFRGESLKFSANEYGVDLILRPVKTPNYGGHIERLMGTVSQEMVKLPGTTHSSPSKRGEYDSDEHAVMSLSELEKWLVLFIYKYHNTIHSGIGMTPLQKYREGLLGGNGRPPRGLPARRLDEEKVRIDFMPMFERTIQPYGVLLDDVYYFSDVLRAWIGTKDPENPKAGKHFKFKRDPRDISQLYFFDPTLKRYFVIPYRDSSLPPVSLHELKEARKSIKQSGMPQFDERILFNVIRQQREIVDEAMEKTKLGRVKHQKRLNNDKAKKQKEKDLPKTTATKEPAIPPVIPGYNPNPNEYFDDEY